MNKQQYTIAGYILEKGDRLTPITFTISAVSESQCWFFYRKWFYKSTHRMLKIANTIVPQTTESEQLCMF